MRFGSGRYTIIEGIRALYTYSHSRRRRPSGDQELFESGGSDERAMLRLHGEHECAPPTTIMVSFATAEPLSVLLNTAPIPSQRRATVVEELGADTPLSWNALSWEKT